MERKLRKLIKNVRNVFTDELNEKIGRQNKLLRKYFEKLNQIEDIL